MIINPINYIQPKFTGRSRLRLNDGNTAVIDVHMNEKGKINSLSCDVMSKGKCLYHYDYSWKYGIDLPQMCFSQKRLARKLGLETEKAFDVLSDTIWEAYMDELVQKSDFDSDIF